MQNEKYKMQNEKWTGERALGDSGAYEDSGDR